MVETKICVLPKEAMDDLILERPWENAIGDHKCVQKYRCRRLHHIVQIGGIGSKLKERPIVRNSLAKMPVQRSESELRSVPRHRTIKQVV
jgi:hypothetical protein